MTLDKTVFLKVKLTTISNTTLLTLKPFHIGKVPALTIGSQQDVSSLTLDLNKLSMTSILTMSIVIATTMTLSFITKIRIKDNS